MKIFINGHIVEDNIPVIYPNDRGFLLGDGLFETIKATHGHMPFFQQHYERLKHAASLLKIPFLFNSTQLYEIIQTLLNDNQLIAKTAVIRITLTRGRSERGITLPKQTHTTLLITTALYEPPSKALRLCISPITRDAHAHYLQLKTTQYVHSIMAKAFANEKGFDDGLMLNTQGMVTEASVANVFLVKDQKILTPKIKQGVFPGIMRQFVLNLCQQHGIPYRETSVFPDHLFLAQEGFVTNSLVGIQPVACFEAYQMDLNKNEMTRFLMGQIKQTISPCL